MPIRTSSPPDVFDALEFVEQRVTEGAFVIGVFDRRTRALVWEGAARAESVSGHVDHARLDRTAEDILSSLPAPRRP